MMKRLLSLLLAAALLCSVLAGCASSEAPTADAVQSAEFTDDLGRTVTLPQKFTRIAPSGAVAAMILATVAPEYMVCINRTPSEAQRDFLSEELFALPETGQMYGAKSTLNLEALLACDAEAVIDLGEKKNGMAEELDALQEQIGIPVIFLEADLPHMAQMYRTLGTLLADKAERSEELAALAEQTVALAAENSAKIAEDERVRVLYTSGLTGLDANARGSVQAQVIELVGAENALVTEAASSKNGGSTISAEELYQLDPDVILFAPDSICDTAAQDDVWSGVAAIAEGRYCEVPSQPYNWMSNPPSLNMLLGVWWLGNLLYPQYYNYNMEEKAQELLAVLWQCDVTREQAAELLQNAALRD